MIFKTKSTPIYLRICSLAEPSYQPYFNVAFSLRLLNFSYVYLCVGMCISMQLTLRPEEVTEFPGAGVTGSCRLPYGGWELKQVLGKSNGCS